MKNYTISLKKWFASILGPTHLYSGIIKAPWFIRGKKGSAIVHLHLTRLRNAADKAEEVKERAEGEARKAIPPCTIKLDEGWWESSARKFKCHQGHAVTVPTMASHQPSAAERAGNDTQVVCWDPFNKRLVLLGRVRIRWMSFKSCSWSNVEEESTQCTMWGMSAVLSNTEGTGMAHSQGTAALPNKYVETSSNRLL